MEAVTGERVEDGMEAVTGEHVEDGMEAVTGERRNMFEESVQQHQEELDRRLREENEARIKAEIPGATGSDNATPGLSQRFAEVVPEDSPLDLKAIKAKRAAEKAAAAERAEVENAAKEAAQAAEEEAAALRALEGPLIDDAEVPAEVDAPGMGEELAEAAEGVKEEAIGAADAVTEDTRALAPEVSELSDSAAGAVDAAPLGDAETPLVDADGVAQVADAPVDSGKKPSVDVVDGHTGVVETPRAFERGVMLQRGEFTATYDSITIPAAQPRNKRLALSSSGLKAFAMKTSVLVSTKGFDAKLRSLLITNPASVGVRDMAWAPARDSDMFALLFAALSDGSAVMHVLFVERNAEGVTGISHLKTETLLSAGASKWSKCRAIGTNLKGKLLLVPETGSKAQIVSYSCTPVLASEMPAVADDAETRGIGEVDEEEPEEQEESEESEEEEDVADAVGEEVVETGAEAMETVGDDALHDSSDVVIEAESLPMHAGAPAVTDAMVLPEVDVPAAETAAH
uniref:Uncharacterized protein n=1 Tax=Erythrolobus madagascarensis TaxID=708628 RepID=A0A7S0T4X7_9RHOD|mmetsp:Transcript_1134/g.2255  ORF Transcript_1134/g.2255 Transcript_1134/m.2255 type:complete len:515 (+) Transcript_1134:1-1545(+)